jgi:hypothetical protein
MVAAVSGFALLIVRWPHAAAMPAFTLAIECRHRPRARKAPPSLRLAPELNLPVGAVPAALASVLQESSHDH